MTTEKKEYKDFVDQGTFKHEEYLDFGRLYFGALVFLVIAIAVFVTIAARSGLVVYEQIQSIRPSIGSNPLPGLAQLVTSHKGEFITIALLATLAFYIVSLVALNLLKLIGTALIWFLTVLTAGLSLLLVYLARELQGYEYVFLIGAIIPPLVLAFFWKRLKIASRLVNLTADLLMKNKRMFWNGVVYGCLYLLLTAGIWMVYIDTFITLSADIQGVILQIKTTDMSQNWFVVGMTLLYLFLVQVSYNYFYGGVVHGAHVFYRLQPEGHFDGLKVLARRFGPVLVYSVFSSIIYTIKWMLTQMAKKSQDVERLSKLGIKVLFKRGAGLVPGTITKKSVQQRLANWAIKMLEKIWLLINFFTLPAIIIENKRASSAIKRSFELVGSNAVDVFIRKTSIRHLFRFTTVVFIILSTLAGAIIGLLFMERFNMDVMTAIAIFMVVIGLFSSVPAWIMSKNLDVVYVTFLYCYILDETLQKGGITGIPSRFLGESDPLDGASRGISRGQKRVTALGSAIACVAVGCILYALITLVGGDQASMNDFTSFHQWLEKVSTFTAYGATCLMIALLSCALARRKYLSISLVLAITIAWVVVIYINWFRPAGDPPGDPWMIDTTVRVFKIFVGSLQVISACCFILGIIVEISLLKHDLSPEKNQAVVASVEQGEIGEESPAVNATS